MRITYDQQADAMFIQLSRKRSIGAQQVNDVLIVHWADDDTILGIELLDISKAADDLPAIIEKYDIVKVREAEQAEREIKEGTEITPHRRG